MIKDPPLLTIRRNFARPDTALVRKFADVPAGNLVDAMGGRGALDWAVKPILPLRGPICGTVITCHCGPSDNLAIFGAVAEARPGDIILAAADSFTGTAIIGDLLAGMAKNKGVAAIITDGLVRDLVGLERVGLPIFARGVTPNSCVRSGPGSIGLPIVIGGVAAEAGDIVLGDRDGVVIVPQRMLAAALTRLEAVRAAEQALEAKVAGGLATPEFIADLFAAGRVDLVE
jgi:4-hydroxy-4-methyl-2-oxoglutarate aldolase